MIGHYFIQNGDISQSYVFFNKALETIGQLRRLNENITKNLTLDIDTMELLKYIVFYVDNMRDPARLRMINKIVHIEYFNIILHEDQMPANLMSMQKQGSNINYQVTDNGLEITNKGNEPLLISSRNFTLKPDTDYKVILDMDYENESNDSLMFSIFSSGKAGNQIRIRDFNEHYTDREYVFNFRTSKDLKPGYQKYMFVYDGNTDDRFSLRSILIIEE